MTRYPYLVSVQKKYPTKGPAEQYFLFTNPLSAMTFMLKCIHVQFKKKHNELRIKKDLLNFLEGNIPFILFCESNQKGEYTEYCLVKKDRIVSIAWT